MAHESPTGYQSAQHIWTVDSDAINFVGALVRVASELGCSLYTERRQSPAGFEEYVFTVYSLGEATVNAFVEAAKTQTPFKNWTISLEPVQAPDFGDMVQWFGEYWSTAPWIDNLILCANHNSYLKKQGKSQSL
jgi:hypothetical protein